MAEAQINEVVTPEIITHEEGKKIASAISYFISSYAKKSKGTSYYKWLLTQFKEAMTEKNEQKSRKNAMKLLTAFNLKRAQKNHYILHYLRE